MGAASPSRSSRRWHWGDATRADCAALPQSTKRDTSASAPTKQEGPEEGPPRARGRARGWASKGLQRGLQGREGGGGG
eukprot:8463283-Pyramimonas_sp.AAC.1